MLWESENVPAACAEAQKPKKERMLLAKKYNTGCYIFSAYNII